MEELLTLVTLWIAANFDLPEAEVHPEIVTVPAASLAEVRAEFAREPGSSPPLAEETVPPEVFAFYHAGSRTIYVSDWWQADTAANLSVLVHEMVHHLQSEAGLDYQCPGQREKAAYDAQERWLSQFGTSIAKEFGIDPVTRLARTVCIH